MSATSTRAPDAFSDARRAISGDRSHAVTAYPNDVSRVPHLRERAWISFPVMQHLEKLKAHAYFSL